MRSVTINYRQGLLSLLDDLDINWEPINNDEQIVFTVSSDEELFQLGIQLALNYTQL